MALNIKPKDATQLDLVALGETMIRLSPPGHGRIEFAPSLEVWVGGGEYNVAYALARLGLRTGWVGGLNTSPMGRIVANHARSVGMDITHAVTRKYDGVGKVDRIGLNFTEVGHSKRASVTLYDRGHSATAGMKPGEVNWKKLFSEQGVRWLHTGGIFAALSDGTRKVVADPKAGYFGTRIDDRSLVPDGAARLGTTHLADWIARRDRNASPAGH